MFWNQKISPEDEERMINMIAEGVHKYGMDLPAILMLESFKPLAYIGGVMGRFFLSPFLPFFGENINQQGEKFLTIFEKEKT